jgi:hypothetical protein
MLRLGELFQVRLSSESVSFGKLVCSRAVDTSFTASESAADEATARGELLQAPYEIGIGAAVSDHTDSLRVLSGKSIGEPYAGNPHVRFDEGRGVNPRAYSTVFRG